MTSFIIGDQANRVVPDSWNLKSVCPFCRIIAGEASAFQIFENEKVVAFLDILPLRPGHTLVVPKAHYARLSELPSDFAAATGEAVTRVAHALTKAIGNTALNVVCNQEYAQAVPHVHYHIIPAPTLESASKASPVGAPGRHEVVSRKDLHRKEFEAREELDEEEGSALSTKIRAHL